MIRFPTSLFSRKFLLFFVPFVLLTVVALFLIRQRITTDQPTSEPKVVEVLPSRARILSETSPESIDESIENLPSFADMLITTAIGFDSSVGVESYGRARMMFPRLNRVRKLLGQIEDSQKPHYTGVFLTKIAECMSGYVDARNEWLAELDKAKGAVTRSEPNLYDQKRAIAGALVYILTEWDCPEGLPAFARILEQPDPLPVNRLFLLYSCHVLIESMPTDGFSPARLDKLNEYKRLASKTFPSAPRIEVPAWNAKYDEADFRAVILEQHIPFDSEPTIRLRIYPDLHHLETPNKAQLKEDADTLQRVMLSFLRTK
jgi:hypothetical protein